MVLQIKKLCEISKMKLTRSDYYIFFKFTFYLSLYTLNIKLIIYILNMTNNLNFIINNKIILF
jgi:hypothetical protein